MARQNLIRKAHNFADFHTCENTQTHAFRSPSCPLLSASHSPPYGPSAGTGGYRVANGPGVGTGGYRVANGTGVGTGGYRVANGPGVGTGGYRVANVLGVGTGGYRIVDWG